MAQLIRKTVWWFLQKLKAELPHDPAILLLGMYPQRIANKSPHNNLYMNIHISIPLNSQNVETAQMSLHW